METIEIIQKIDNESLLDFKVESRIKCKNWIDFFSKNETNSVKFGIKVSNFDDEQFN